MTSNKECHLYSRKGQDQLGKGILNKYRRALSLLLPQILFKPLNCCVFAHLQTRDFSQYFSFVGEMHKSTENKVCLEQLRRTLPENRVSCISNCIQRKKVISKILWLNMSFLLFQLFGRLAQFCQDTSKIWIRSDKRRTRDQVPYTLLSTPAQRILTRQPNRERGLIVIVTSQHQKTL